MHVCCKNNAPVQKSIDEQVRIVRLVRLVRLVRSQTDNFRLFLLQ